ncbi:uncharacterized protein LOC113211010 [Frankliniella occidentalis]|uniref:Uncharacterized protein LOC113211010 n=1 Tax=Frankliniella occidentalis TaxID=133901 RepID=A0A9C6X8U0_FRAOC|nr:uncharacterized protein LOC113211010 [Frankliniella occidentalis]
MTFDDPGGWEAGLVKVKQNLSTLRTVLSKKCKSFARAVVTTVPPLPKLLAPKGGDEDYRHLWTTFNDELLQLSSPRFFVLDVQEFFMKDGLLQEDLFESFMGHGAKRRKDRLHINHNGMNAIEEALRTVPPFQRTAKNNL